MTGLWPGGEIAVSGDAVALSFVVAGLLLLAFVAGVWASRRPVDVLDDFDMLQELSGALDDRSFTWSARGVVVHERPWLRPAMPIVKPPKEPCAWGELYEGLYGEPVSPPMPNCGACNTARECSTPAVCRAVARLQSTSSN